MTNVKANLIGGATIAFGYLIDYLNQSKQSYTLVNTQQFPKGWKRYLNPFYVLVKVLLNFFSADVIFLNSSRGGTKYLAPMLFYLAKIFRMKFVFRPFGGDINEYTAAYGNWQKYIFRKTILKADILFLETKKLMQFYAKQNTNTIQLANSRNEPPKELLRGMRQYERRFIFLGFINKTKGINHLLEAAEQLGDSYTIHIFGPIRDNYNDPKQERFAEKFKKQKGIYQGTLDKEKVLITLREYDVLVLPTYYKGEGYPGVIMEAYSLGLPVISTHWKSIPEIVVDKKTGLLIETKSTAALIEAMKFFDESNFEFFSKNARAYFQKYYSTKKVTGAAIEAIKKLF